MPLQTTIQNLKEKITGIGVAQQAVGLEHHRKDLAAYRRRTREGFEAMAQATGFDTPSSAAGRDDMGDLVITGDIQLDNKQSSHPSNGATKVVGAAVLGAALAGGPAIGYWWGDREEGGEEPTAVVADSDASNTIRPDDQP